MNFVGSKIIYAFMQAVGMVNDHVKDCFRRSAAQSDKNKTKTSKTKTKKKTASSKKKSTAKKKNSTKKKLSKPKTDSNTKSKQK